MKITKVFTKYDEPISKICIPTFGNITANPSPSLSDDENMYGKDTELYPRHIRYGLEDVVFIEYGKKKIKC